MDINDLKQLRVGVLGLGQEGQAVTTYLLRHGIKPVLFDKKQVPDQTGQNLTTHSGEDYLEHLSEVDVIFRSPGVWRLLPQLIEAEKQGLVIISQAQWFFDHCPAKIIGVTGTKGKGTTASLIAHFLQQQPRSKVYLTGNVGQIQPVEILEQLGAEDLIVYELSSFQLQDLKRSPHIAVVLMVTSDHLDVHADEAEYHTAKSAITKFQSETDFAIINDDYKASKALGQLGQGQKLWFSRRHQVPAGGQITDGRLTIIGSKPEQFDLTLSPLRGRHNWDNIAAAILAVLQLGVSAEIIRKALPSFKPLPHRLELVAETAGVKFYDDSISTVPDTAAAAIASFDEPLAVLVGGSDKGLDPEPLIRAILSAPNIKTVAALGQTGPMVAEKLKAGGFAKPIVQNRENLQEVLRDLQPLVTGGDVVLLSPGYASFDWYNNYKERGDDFSRLAKQWGQL